MHKPKTQAVCTRSLENLNFLGRRVVWYIFCFGPLGIYLLALFSRCLGKLIKKPYHVLTLALKPLEFSRYTRVFDLVTTFLNQAEKEIPKAAVVMYLGAAKEIATHKDPAL